MTDRFDIFNACKTCGVSILNRGQEFRARHHAWHDSMGQTLDLPPAPPTPKWRELVDERRELALAFIRVDDETPLREVLYRLHCIIADTDHRAKELAAIVAIAEAEVGNGWQADPSGWPPGRANVKLLVLNMVISEGDEVYCNWRGFANAAAAWLRDLTDGGEA